MASLRRFALLCFASQLSFFLSFFPFFLCLRLRRRRFRSNRRYNFVSFRLAAGVEAEAERAPQKYTAKENRPRMHSLRRRRAIANVQPGRVRSTWMEKLLPVVVVVVVVLVVDVCVRLRRRTKL